MTTALPKKALIVSGCALLLGFGLCGLDTLMPGHKQEFGGAAAFLGFVLCLASMAFLVVCGIWLIVALIVESRSQRP